MAMNTLNTMRRPLPAEIMTLHNPRMPTPFGRRDYINVCPIRDRVDSQRLTHFHAVRRIATTKLPDERLRLTIRLHGNLNPCSRPLFLATTGDISHMTASSTAIATKSPNLRHNARPSLNHCHRNNDTFVVVNLCHPNFFTKQTDRHSAAPVR
jgi:hypothetical protein